MRMNFSFIVTLMVLLLIALGCTQTEVPAAPTTQPETPATTPETPAASPETPATTPETPATTASEEAKTETKTEAEAAPVATNTVKLVSADGYLTFEQTAVELKVGESLTFLYEGNEKGKTVVTITDEAGKFLPGVVNKPWTSGYMTVQRTEWTTPAFEKAGNYLMKITFGKPSEGTIVVK